MSQVVDELRVELSKKLSAQRLSLRQLQELTGVSFSTLSRFLRGGSIGSDVHDRIVMFLNGDPTPKRKLIQSKRITLGKDSFLITIEKL